VITIAYLALINAEQSEPNLKPSTDVSEVKWFSINQLPKLAFDHQKIIEYAIKRLRWKFEYTPIVFSLLPKKFKIPQIRKIYEIVFNKKFDKRNFRKKLLSLNILEETKEIEKNVPYRPAKFYRLKEKIPEVLEII